MSPDHAEFLHHHIFLPGLKSEHPINLAVIGAIPLYRGDYRPDEISKSALDLAWHITATEMRFMDAVLAGGFDFTPNPRPASIANSADLSRWYVENFEERFGKVSKLPKEHLVQIVDFRGLVQLPVVMYLSFVRNHSVHHRGQLSMYLRPMGAKVPAIYGESFDSAEARKAAQKLMHDGDEDSALRGQSAVDRGHGGDAVG
jgi:uncharacterized damage-inducible protein DinB